VYNMFGARTRGYLLEIAPMICNVQALWGPRVRGNSKIVISLCAQARLTTYWGRGLHTTPRAPHIFLHGPTAVHPAMPSVSHPSEPLSS